MDTNIMVGNFNPEDDHHKVASEFMKRLKSQGYLPVLSIAVIVESYGLLKSRRRGEDDFLRWISTPGQALILPEDPELVDPTNELAAKVGIDFVDVFLAHMVRDIRLRCPTVPQVPIATLDRKDYFTLLGSLDCPLELMDLETLMIDQYDPPKSGRRKRV